jgi:hypothetical protein
MTHSPMCGATCRGASTPGLRGGLRNTPFFRPPFGVRNERIGRIAAEALMAAARKWFAAQRIVVGHANHATVTTVHGDLLALVAERGLRTVTPADVWATPAQLLRGATATGRVALD